MAARQGTPRLGVLADLACSREDRKHPKRWTVTVGYRYQPSYRHFVGTVEQKQRELLRTQIYNLYHLFDVAVERRLSPRWSATASLPIVFSHRDQLYNPRANMW